MIDAQWTMIDFLSIETLMMTRVWGYKLTFNLPHHLSASVMTQSSKVPAISKPTTMSTTIHPREPPPLGELATVIQKALSTNFTTATVRVAQCPDLRDPPFHLAAPGLSGNPRIADIGGRTNLFPCANLQAKYSLLSMAKEMEMSPAGGSLIGAGAAPFQDLGHNAELAANIAWAQNQESAPDFENTDSLSVSNKTRVIEVDSTGSALCCPAQSTNCALMMNLYGCSGDPGPVLKVTVKGRTGKSNFTDCI